MSKLYSFLQGGIRLPLRKITKDKPIEFVGLPPMVTIPVKQHIGTPSKIIVNKGDKVKVGTLLADFDGEISSDVHSSVSGEIVKLEKIPNSNGYEETMLSIKVEGDEWEEDIDTSKDIIREINYTKEEIIQKIRNSGIVGLGGSGFPTPIKTTIPEDKKIDMLIINGIECEPFLTADDRLMQEYAEQIIIGARVLNRVLGIQNAIIAIDENKPQAIANLQKLSKLYVGVNVRICKNKYPQGSEKQLVKAITGKEIPEGKLPIDVGCVVQNVATVYAVYEAVLKNKPLFERIVTISGDACNNPTNYLVRVGTPVSYLIKKNQSDLNAIEKVVLGGPMMGEAITNIDAPITKTNSGILLFKGQEFLKKQPSQCIRCGKCVDACPMGLNPYAIKEVVKHAGSVSELRELHAANCIKCGCCAYVCPAHLPLLDYCKLAKKEFRKK